MNNNARSPISFTGRFKGSLQTESVVMWVDGPWRTLSGELISEGGNASFIGENIDETNTKFALTFTPWDWNSVVYKGSIQFDTTKFWEQKGKQKE